MRTLLPFFVLFLLTVPAVGASAPAVDPSAAAAHSGFSVPSPSSSAPSATTRQTAPLTVEGYRDLLRSALADLDRRGAQSAPQVAGRLRAIRSVALPDGSLVTPDLAAAAAALQSTPLELETAKTRLRALVGELDRSLVADAAGSSPDAADRLSRVLARPEFQPEPENPISAFLRELLKPLEEPVGSFLGLIGRWLEDRLQGIGPWVGWRPLLTFLGLVLLGGLFLWVGLRLREVMGSAPARVLPEREAGGESSAGLRSEGLRLAQEGDFRGAIRVLYLAALLYWQEKGRLRFDRALTNREVLARARLEADPGLVETLGPLVEAFDRVWYGGAPCSQAEYAHFAGLADRAWEAA